ncbi:MAG TPA: alkaline phosphatase D family protein [Candidatus Limnocylindrales bacterium]
MSQFRYGVASGDPAPDRVVLWTRLERGGSLRWEVAEGSDFQSVVNSASVESTPDSDFCVSVDVGGLKPCTTYWYRFRAPDGEWSPVGRTKTLPVGDARRVRFAVVSCAKFNAGFFNGYARIAERDDLDFVLHLGDYIYEASETPPANQTPGADIGRPFEPRNECVTLADYRTRYAQYRADPDTQAMHAAHPLIATIDDHELADGGWRDGADNHLAERDGPWPVRRAAAFKARREWLPQRLPDPADPLRVYRSVSLGDVADMFVIDTRSLRDQPVHGPGAVAPARSQLGHAQRDWLFAGLQQSRAQWRLLANSSILGRTWAPNLPPELHEGLTYLKLIHKSGTGPDPDQWEGYPYERDLLIGHLARANTVVLSGDIHVGMALELERDEEPGKWVAPEFVTTSLTSQNLDDKTGWGYRTRSTEVERLFVSARPNVAWCDMDSHGYMVADLTPDRLRIEWWFVDTVLARSPNERLAAYAEVLPGSPEIVNYSFPTT